MDERLLVALTFDAVDVEAAPPERCGQFTEIATGKPARLRVGRNGGGERVRGRW